MLKFAVLLALSQVGCGAILASQQYQDAREECRQKYTADSEDRQECLEEATEVYRQRSSNLRQAAHDINERKARENSNLTCYSRQIGNDLETSCR